MVNCRVLGVAWVCAAPAMAADPLEQVFFDDDILTEPQVTAEAVFIGLTWPRVDGVAPVEDATILAAIPEAMRKNEVCVRVTTEDGLYAGEARFLDRIGVATSAMTLLPYGPPKSGLKNYADARVAVLAYACSPSAGLAQLAVASWRSTQARDLGDTAHLLVNSFRADEAFLILNDSNEVECRSIEVGERTAYDFVCPLPIDDIKGGADIDLFRIRGASLDPAVSVNIIGWE